MSTDVTMVWTISCGILVTANGTEKPSASDWDACIQYAIANRDRFRAQLAVTDGASPDAKQRAQLAAQEFLLDRRAAIVSSNPLIRGPVTALNWLSMTKVKAFAPSEYSAVFDYLSVAQGDRHAMLREIAGLRVRLATNSTTESVSTDMSATARQLEEIVSTRLTALRAKLASGNR